MYEDFGSRRARPGVGAQVGSTLSGMKGANTPGRRGAVFGVWWRGVRPSGLSRARARATAAADAPSAAVELGGVPRRSRPAAPPVQAAGRAAGCGAAAASRPKNQNGVGLRADASCLAAAEGVARHERRPAGGCAQFAGAPPVRATPRRRQGHHQRGGIDRLEALDPSAAPQCEKVVDGVMTNQVDFFIMQAHHDYCDHDTLPTGAEKIFHDWEAHCLNCVIKREDDDNLADCPAAPARLTHPRRRARHARGPRARARGDGHAHRRLWAQEQRARRSRQPRRRPPTAPAAAAAGSGRASAATAGVDSLRPSASRRSARRAPRRTPTTT